MPCDPFVKVLRCTSVACAKKCAKQLRKGIQKTNMNNQNSVRANERRKDRQTLRPTDMTNEQTTYRTEEWETDPPNQSINERPTGRMKKRTSDRKNEPTNQLTNEKLFAWIPSLERMPVTTKHLPAQLFQKFWWDFHQQPFSLLHRCNLSWAVQL